MTLLERLTKALDPDLWGLHSVGIIPDPDNPQVFQVTIEEHPPVDVPSKLPEQSEVCEACQ